MPFKVLQKVKLKTNNKECWIISISETDIIKLREIETGNEFYTLPENIEAVFEHNDY